MTRKQENEHEMEDYALGFTYIKKWIKKEIKALVVELLREVEDLAQVL